MLITWFGPAAEKIFVRGHAGGQVPNLARSSLRSDPSAIKNGTALELETSFHSTGWRNYDGRSSREQLSGVGGMPTSRSKLAGSFQFCYQSGFREPAFPRA